MRSRIAAVTVGALVVVGLGAGGAVAGSMITGEQIRNGSIRAVDIGNGSLKGVDLGTDTLGRRQLRPNSVGTDQLSDWVMGEVRDDSTGLKNVEADGPYPGTGFDLQRYEGQGANSTDVWAGDSQALNTTWVRCADGKAAIGGGFSRFRDAAQADSDINVVSSFPAFIDQDGNIDFAAGEIEGDPAHSFQPNGWVVEGYNEGGTPLNVRPWVTCADMDD